MDKNTQQKRTTSPMPTEEYEAARKYASSVLPLFNTISETPEVRGMSVFDEKQIIDAFIAGQQWLRDRIARRVPLDTITAEGAMNVLKDFLYAIPKGWSIEQAIEHLKNL